MALSTNGTAAERLSSDAASHLRTFVGQDVYDLSLSFAQWKRARSELLSREKKSSAPKAYVTFQTARAAVAAIARSARLPPQQEQLFLLLAREFEEERSARWAAHTEPHPARERDPRLFLTALELCANAPFTDAEPPPHARLPSLEVPSDGPELDLTPLTDLAKVPTTDAPSVLRDSDYPYYGRIDWFPAEELFDGDHPSRPRERWLELVDDWLPHVRDSIIKMRDDPVAAEERRVQPSSMVFETDEYSHWAKFIDENQRTRLFHFDIQKRDTEQGPRIMARKADFSDKRTLGFNAQFILREDPDFADKELIHWGTWGIVDKAATEDGIIINVPLASASKHFSELFALNDVEVKRGFRWRKSSFPHRSPIYIAAVGSAFRSWKLACRQTADFGSPRNHRLSALGLPFAPNDGCDLSDFDTYPDHPYVHVKDILPNIAVLTNAFRWIQHHDPVAAKHLTVTGWASDISAYFRWLKKRSFDSWRQAIFVVDEDDELQFNDSDAAQFGERPLPSIAQRGGNGITRVKRMLAWRLERRLWSIAEDPDHELNGAAQQICPPILKQWSLARAEKLGPSCEASEISQDQPYFMEECIDDAMGAALGPFRAAFLLFVSCYCFEAAGLQVNKDKNQLGHSLELLGLLVFLRHFLAALSEQKLRLLDDWPDRILSLPIVEHDEVEGFLGFMQYASFVKQSAALYLRRSFKFLHVTNCWSFLQGGHGLSHRWNKGSDWFVRDISAARDLIKRADGIAMIQHRARRALELFLELCSDACRNFRNLKAYSGAGGVLKLPSGEVYTWSFRFPVEIVKHVPIHILEACLLPVQENLFKDLFHLASETLEWCDNSPAVSAFDLRKPKDARMLFYVLERDDLLDLAAEDHDRLHSVKHIGTHDNLYADMISRGKIAEAIELLVDDGYQHLRHFHLSEHACWPYVESLLERVLQFTLSSSDPSRSADRFDGTC